MCTYSNAAESDIDNASTVSSYIDFDVSYHYHRPVRALGRQCALSHLWISARYKLFVYLLFPYLQYDARDKYPSGVVGGRTVIESVAVAASADGESGAKVKRIARKT